MTRLERIWFGIAICFATVGGSNKDEEDADDASFHSADIQDVRLPMNAKEGGFSTLDGLKGGLEIAFYSCPNGVKLTEGSDACDLLDLLSMGPDSSSETQFTGGSVVGSMLRRVQSNIPIQRSRVGVSDLSSLNSLGSLAGKPGDLPATLRVSLSLSPKVMGGDGFASTWMSILDKPTSVIQVYHEDPTRKRCSSLSGLGQGNESNAVVEMPGGVQRSTSCTLVLQKV